MTGKGSNSLLYQHLFFYLYFCSTFLLSAFLSPHITIFYHIFLSLISFEAFLPYPLPRGTIKRFPSAGF
jgi:hypothetical protein